MNAQARTLTVVEHVSLDGVMQAPALPDEDGRDGFAHGGWAAPYTDEIMMEKMSPGLASGGEMILGRRTYEGLAAFWPHQTDGNPFTAALDATTKYVASRTLRRPLAWQNSQVIEGDVAAFVRKLKAEEGPGLVTLGSGELVQSLHAAGLVDIYTLVIDPVVLGGGRRLFADPGAYATFELVESTPTTTGAIVATYRRTEAPA